MTVAATSTPVPQAPGKTAAREHLGEAVLRAGRKLVFTNGAEFTTQDLVQEAGVSLQTFYRYFPTGKDGLLLALIEELIADHCANLRQLASGIADPVARCDFYIRSTLVTPESPEVSARARFITSEHWRLHQRFPRDVWAATAPMTDLIRDTLVAGRDTGQFSSRNPPRDAWLITKTILSAFHHHVFVPDDEDMRTLADDVAHFCLTAVGARVSELSDD